MWVCRRTVQTPQLLQRCTELLNGNHLFLLMRTDNVINKCVTGESEWWEWMEGSKGSLSAAVQRFFIWSAVWKMFFPVVVKMSLWNFSWLKKTKQKQTNNNNKKPPKTAATFGQPHLISQRITVTPCLIWLLGILVTSLFCVACGRKEGSGREEMPQKQV